MSETRIGALRQRVMLQQQVRTASAGGAAEIAWSDVAEMFAQVEPTAGRERPLADGMSHSVTHRVVVRHRAGVTPAMRFVAGSCVLDIQAVLDVDGRGRWLRCDCLERAP